MGVRKECGYLLWNELGGGSGIGGMAKVVERKTDAIQKGQSGRGQGRVPDALTRIDGTK